MFNENDYPLVDEETLKKRSFREEDFPLAPPTKGWKGVGQDLSSSLKSAPDAAWEMLKALPGEAYASGGQIINNPKRAASNVAGGTMKGMRGMVNAPANINDYLREKELSPIGQMPKVVPTSLEEYLLSGNEPGDPLLRGMGEYLPFGAIGRGMKGVSGMANRAGGAGLMAAGTGEGDPLHAAMLSMFGEGAGNLGKKAYEFKPDFKPNTLKGVEIGDVRATVEAAERLGLPYITPGEASGFGYVGKQEGRIGNTLEGSKLREKKAAERAVSEESIINGFLNKLDDKIELPKEKKALYDSVMSTSVPDDFVISTYLNSEVIQKAFKTVESNPVYKDTLKGVPQNSFQYLDQVKKALDDMEQSKKRKGNLHEAMVIGDTRRKLVSEMDSINPDYARARKLGQRTILRREIDRGFDKKEMTGRNFYNTVIKSKEKFSKLYDDLSEFPDMQQQLLDMKEVFPKLYGTADAKAAVKGERSGYETPRADFAYLTKLFKQKLNERGDIKDVEAITSPDWYRKMLENGVNQSGRIMPPEVQNLFRDYMESQYMGIQADREAERLMKDSKWREALVKELSGKKEKPLFDQMTDLKKQGTQNVTQP